MRRVLLVMSIAIAACASAAAPGSAAEFRKVPPPDGSTNDELRTTPDVDDGKGGVNTNPAMTPSTSSGTSKSTTSSGDACRNGRQTYPNVSTDNPPGLQPCPL